MIISLIIWLFRKYRNQLLNTYNLNFNRIVSGVKRLVMLSLLMGIALPSLAQQQTLNYIVLHNGNTVGHMQLQQTQDGDDLYLKVASEVKMRFIMSIKVNVQEDSHYRNGKLISSHVYRTVNGKEKANRFTKAAGDTYQLIADGKAGSLNQKQISNSITMMYLHEPLGISQIYSDNFQQFIAVKPQSNHSYRIDLPDGNYNLYTYANGICTRVDLHHSLYTIQIQLTNPISII